MLQHSSATFLGIYIICEWDQRNTWDWNLSFQDQRINCSSHKGLEVHHLCPVSRNLVDGTTGGSGLLPITLHMRTVVMNFRALCVLLQTELHYNHCSLHFDLDSQLSIALAGVTSFRTWFGAAKPFLRSIIWEGATLSIVSIFKLKISKIVYSSSKWNSAPREYGWSLPF